MAKNTKKTRGLGRGLSALMADVETSDTSSVDAPPKGGSEVTTLSIDLIFPNKDQPRKDFGQDDLQELSNSIAARGIIQPLIVRDRKSKKGTFEIVAGERRWRAAQLAQLHEVPVVVREFSDQEVLEVAIIENVQRADLNPIEEAMGYDQLMNAFGHTQQAVSDAMGKSRSHIANLLRLLQLPKDIQAFVQNGDLSAGHARALITSSNPKQLALEVIKQGLSVRQTEDLVKKPKAAAQSGASSKSKPEKDADTKAIEAELSAHLGMKVSIDYVSEEKGGKMVLSFRSLEQLDDLLNALST